jgi:MoaA/NifB/PqqE/SkfB family radical SAM enzyme
MSRVSFVTGIGRRWFDLTLSFRVLAAGARRLGLVAFPRELSRYLRDNRNLLAGAADRYVQRDGQIYAAAALPPLSSRAFVEYLCDEVETFNHKKLSPIVMALVSVTCRCPYRCAYCYALEELRDEEVVPAAALARSLADLERLKIPTVFLTGGEVMMRREELPTILEPCRASGTAVWLVSSGWGMTREALEGLLPSGLCGVVISLDSCREDEVRKMKGHPDAFKNALGAIEAATSLDLLVSVDCIATPRLLEPGELEAFMEFLASRGVHFVNFLPLQKTGGALREKVPFLTTQQFMELDRLMRAANRGRRHRGWPLAYSPMVWEAQRGCTAGQQFVFVNPLGEVRPCPFLREPVGNIRDTPLAEVVGRMRGGGERQGCYVMYAGLPTRTRLGGVRRLPVLQDDDPGRSST